MNPRLLFFHIPKTAGTSFCAFLEHQLGAENCSGHIKSAKFGDALRQHEHSQLISGHMYATVGDHLPRDRTSIIILRDPVDRVLSAFYYGRRDVNEVPAYRRAGRSGGDLVGDIGSILDGDDKELNLQTEMLYPLGTSQAPPLGWQTKVSAAKHAIDSFEMVGIQSELEDFCAMISGKLGWNNRGSLAHLNATSKRPMVDDLSRNDLAKLRELLAPDIEVFDYARTRFAADRRRLISSASSVEESTPERTERPAKAGLDGVDKTEEPRAMEGGLTEFGDKAVEIVSVTTIGELSRTCYVLTGEVVTISIAFFVHTKADNFTAGFSVRDRRGVCLFGSNTRLHGQMYDLNIGAYTAEFKFLNRFAEGAYRVDVDLHRGLSMYEGHFHSKMGAAPLEIVGKCGGHFDGTFLIDTDVAIMGTDGTWVRASEAADTHLPAAFVGRLNPVLGEVSGRLRQLNTLSSLEASGGAVVSVEIQNTSRIVWPSSGTRSVQLSYHWRSEGGEVLAEGLRTRLPEDLGPGESVVLRGVLRAPNMTGRTQLIWDLLQEHVLWFSERDPQCAASCWVDII